MKRLLSAACALVCLASLTAFAQTFTPRAEGAYINTGSGWSPWANGSSFGALDYTPYAVGMYCQNTAGGSWTPCQGGGGGGGLPLSGGTLTGPLVLSGDPTASAQAATKNYVDATQQYLPNIESIVEGDSIAHGTNTSGNLAFASTPAPGSGYSGTGTCAISGGTSTIPATCAATVNKNGGILFTLANLGNYSAVPTIAISGFTGGSGASATLSIPSMAAPSVPFGTTVNTLPALNGKVSAYTNSAVAGSVISDVASRYVSNSVGAQCALAGSTYTKVLYSAFVGTNNLLAASVNDAVSMWGAYQNLLRRAKADGCTVIAFTILPRGGLSTSQENQRVAFNTYVRQGVLGVDYDVLVDTAALLNNAFDQTIISSSDALHPTQAGYNLMASLENSALLNVSTTADVAPNAWINNGKWIDFACLTGGTVCYMRSWAVGTNPTLSSWITNGGSGTSLRVDESMDINGKFTISKASAITPDPQSRGSETMVPTFSIVNSGGALNITSFLGGATTVHFPNTGTSYGLLPMHSNVQTATTSIALFADTSWQDYTLTGNVSTTTITNGEVMDGSTLNFRLCQNATGGWSWTPPATFDWDANGIPNVAAMGPSQCMDIFAAYESTSTRWKAHFTQVGNIVPATTAGTCSATLAGQIQYTQGNSTTKDIVQVCAHDASNVYAWRAIY